jgi:hypothetical protein
LCRTALKMCKLGLRFLKLLMYSSSIFVTSSPLALPHGAEWQSPNCTTISAQSLFLWDKGVSGIRLTASIYCIQTLKMV